METLATEQVAPQQQQDLTIRVLGVSVKESTLKIVGKYFSLVVIAGLVIALVVQTNRLEAQHKQNAADKDKALAEKEKMIKFISDAYKQSNDVLIEMFKKEAAAKSVQK